MRNLKVRDMKKIIIYGVIGLFLLITIVSSFQTIKSGEVGLKVRFGKIVSSQLNEGFNFKIPYIEDIVIVNIKVQKIELRTESSSKDLQTIETDIAVNILSPVAIFIIKWPSSLKLFKVSAVLSFNSFCIINKPKNIKFFSILFLDIFIA